MTTYSIQLARYIRDTAEVRLLGDLSQEEAEKIALQHAEYINWNSTIMEGPIVEGYQQTE